ncbi:Transposase domain [Halopseudomonas pachastrellae]|nr:Transposase domain [Halopseudomonas pachastrellae]
MMGQLPGGQHQLFYSFNLEDHVLAQHLFRSIDQCLDFSDLGSYLADFYSPIGRPSVDPELMVRMLIVGYCYGIRCERRLCEQVHLNPAYRWLCRLGLEDEVPNHSTLRLLDAAITAQAATAEQVVTLVEPSFSTESAKSGHLVIRKPGKIQFNFECRSTRFKWHLGALQHPLRITHSAMDALGRSAGPGPQGKPETRFSPQVSGCHGFSSTSPADR